MIVPLHERRPAQQLTKPTIITQLLGNAMVPHRIAYGAIALNLLSSEPDFPQGSAGGIRQVGQRAEGKVAERNFHHQFDWRFCRYEVFDRGPIVYCDAKSGQEAARDG